MFNPCYFENFFYSWFWQFLLWSYALLFLYYSWGFSEHLDSVLKSFITFGKLTSIFLSNVPSFFFFFSSFGTLFCFQVQCQWMSHLALHFMSCMCEGFVLLFLIFFFLHLFALFLDFRLSRAFTCEPVVFTFIQDAAKILSSQLLRRESHLRFPALGRNLTLIPVHPCANPS